MLNLLRNTIAMAAHEMLKEKRRDRNDIGISRYSKIAGLVSDYEKVVSSYP